MPAVLSFILLLAVLYIDHSEHMSGMPKIHPAYFPVLERIFDWHIISQCPSQTPYTQAQTSICLRPRRKGMMEIFFTFAPPTCSTTASALNV